MPIFAFLIILSFFAYIMYKVRTIRATLPYTKLYWSSKASISLGLTMFLFGVNQLFVRITTVSVFISLLFILVGVFSAFYAFKRLKEIRSKAEAEWA
ncbi:YtpI family protein [Mangrovibacillus cuniculi]|uniref:YtpI-like protein n=1 Tax=Mangrovibacillus cuniculi TaxID=2593652 RepID=A0A7S8CC45_9BACI|nr:YtpI family protein [Mangrovibacillus cuniculi]QPC47217.1 hypothetical protein G8O30_09655 [Mangrovibacillus cuniculi]